MTEVLSWIGRQPWTALVVALVLETALIVASQGDFVPADPLWYADLGNQIATDPGAAFAAPLNHPFHMRVGLTVPLALFYRMFGVTTLVTNLPCLLAALGVLLVAYAAAPTPRAKRLALLFGLACPALLRETYLLNVDLPCAALMACSILFLSRSDRRRGAWWLVGAVAVWMAAFLVKETAIWCIPIWIYAIVRDLRAVGLREVGRRFAPALGVGVALAIGYLGLCVRVWGDPWARFAGIQELTGGHNWSLEGAPWAVWARRLTSQPALLFARMFQVLLVPVVLAPWLVRGRDLIWWVATATMVLLFWFGSTSFSSFSPLPTIARMVVPALPALIVLAALAGDRAIEHLQGSRWLTPIVLAFLVALLVPAALAIRSTVLRPRPETVAFAKIRGLLAIPGHPVVLVCGDLRCPAITSFNFGFSPPANLTVVFAPDFPRASIPSGAKIVAMVNLSRGAGSEWATPTTYDVQQIVALDLPTIMSSRDVRLYDAGDGKRLRTALGETP